MVVLVEEDLRTKQKKVEVSTINGRKDFVKRYTQFPSKRRNLKLIVYLYQDRKASK